jgi:ADP-heptose:LPS heptosyltransferase
VSRFDAAFIFTSFSQTPFPPAYACYLAGIPVRAAQAAEFGGSLLSHQVGPAADGTHQVDRNLHLLEALGLPVPSRSLAISLPPAAIDASRRLLATIGVDASAPFVAIAPGASAAARRYPAARFAEVARLLGREVDWPIVVVGGQADVEAGAMIAAATPRVRTIAGRTTTAEWASVIGAAAVLVSSHSAPIHLADALGTPTVCLFSGTDRESEWAPRDTPAILLREPTACAPCRLFDCPIGLPCLDIEPAAVVRAALKLLDRASDGVRRVPRASAVVTAATPSPAAPRTEDRWARSAF